MSINDYSSHDLLQVLIARGEIDGVLEQIDDDTLVDEVKERQLQNEFLEDISNDDLRL